MSPLFDIPKILYKYRIWEEVGKEKQLSRRILTDNEVYLASPDQFNDPFDGSLPFKYKKEELTKENVFLKLREIIKRENPEISEEKLHEICFERQSSGIFENDEYWKSYYPTFKKEIINKFGILSLTSKKDDILMWSHYADSHRGFCVGIDRDILFKKCEGQISKVIYSNTFPSIPLFEKSAAGLSILTITKATYWSYEAEIRITKIESPRKSITLPNEAISEIILGCHMLPENKHAIYKIAKKKFSHAKIYEAKASFEEFKLDFLPML